MTPSAKIGCALAILLALGGLTLLGLQVAVVAWVVKTIFGL